VLISTISQPCAAATPVNTTLAAVSDLTQQHVDTMVKYAWHYFLPVTSTTCGSHRRFWQTLQTPAMLWLHAEIDEAQRACYAQAVAHTHIAREAVE
jgi:predicted phage tail protein